MVSYCSKDRLQHQGARQLSYLCSFQGKERDRTGTVDRDILSGCSQV